MTAKLYLSKAWMQKRLFRDRKTPEEIAKECGVTPMTIYRAIRTHGFKR